MKMLKPEPKKTGQTYTQEVETRIQQTSLRDSIERSIFIAYLLSISFSAYAISSYSFIHKFAPEITFFQNLWPRILFNSIPLFFLAIYLRRSKGSDKFKFHLSVLSFSAITHIAAWIHVWQISLSGHPEILPYVNSANVYLVAFIYATIAPPGKLIVSFTAVLCVVFIFPFYTVAYLSKDPAIFNLVVNDLTLTLISGIILSQVIHKLRVKIARLELEKEAKAKQFLGPVLAEAVFENRQELLTKKRARAFVASIDIRDSTELMNRYGDRWLTLRLEHFSLVTKTVAKYGGYIQKTIGDCHVINFGINDEADLSDIPGIEAEEDRAEERRLQYFSNMVFKCMAELFQEFTLLGQKHFPELDIRLGGGIDKGIIERNVQGNEGQSLELDFNGVPVNCSNRLQDYTKQIANRFDKNASLLAVAPFAADYIDAKELPVYKRISTTEHQVRNFPGIKWILVREFKPIAQSQHSSNQSEKHAA